MMPSCLPSHTTTLEHIYICITAVVTILRIYGFTPLPPPPLGWVRDADPRIKLPPERASGGPTGYPPAGDQPCAARCGRALIGGAPARRCTRLPLCQPRQRAGGAQSRSEETARSQGAAGARRKTEGKWPPHTASGGPPADACGVALRATGPFSVRCTTASLKRAPAGSGRSRDGLKLRPQLLGGVRMAGLERLLARYPHPDAAAISPPRSFAAFAERRRWVGPNHGAPPVWTVHRGGGGRPPRLCMWTTPRR